MAADNFAPVPMFHAERRIGQFLPLKDQGRIQFCYDQAYNEHYFVWSSRGVSPFRPHDRASRCSERFRY